MFQSTGALVYGEESRLVVNVDDELARYYRSMIPPSIATQKPRWPAHITVVRGGKETPPNSGYWGKYHGEMVEFNYDPAIVIDKAYIWLNVWCDRLVQIREELGLPPKSRWTKPPSGGHQCFHLTVANRKF